MVVAEFPAHDGAKSDSLHTHRTINLDTTRTRISSSTTPLYDDVTSWSYNMFSEPEKILRQHHVHLFFAFPRLGVDDS